MRVELLGNLGRAVARGTHVKRLTSAGVLAAMLAAVPAAGHAEQPDLPGTADLPAGAAQASPPTTVFRPGSVGPMSRPPAQAASPVQAAPSAAAPVTHSAGFGTSTAVSGVDGAGNGEAHRSPPAPSLATPVPSAPAAPVQHVAPIQAAPAQGAAPAMAAPAPVAPAPSQSAAQPVPATPVAQADPLDLVAGEIRALLVHPDALTANKSFQEGLATFYGVRDGRPVFVDASGFDPRGNAVIARLRAAEEDGLDPDDYAVPPLPRRSDALTLARAELHLAVAALTYARHAQAGRFEPSRISSLVTPKRDIPDPAAVLDALAAAPDADAALAAFNPPHAGYRALKAKLKEVAGQTTPKIAAVPTGPLLRPGASDPRVPALRVRLGTSGAANDLIYDQALVDAVKAFQESSGVSPTGNVGTSTIAALNKDAGGGGGSLAADVIANMERWRWLPRDLGDAYVMVNIPEYLVRIYQGDRKVHETRVVVGKPQTPTPLLSRDMQYVVVNPAWNIPPSIARNEMMPLLRSDPSALGRRGIQVVRNSSGGVSFRQPPGERNALGRIKFMFPNDHSVYLHDTPSRSLFQNDRRAYSHGCVRVFEPLKFGEMIFTLGMPGDTWTEGRIAKMFGSQERYVNLKQRFPVHIVYFNAVVDETGRLRVREDLYGLNAQVKSILGLEGRRRMADSQTTRTR
ncbi:L,D-transpeptidase scaffold domain-containing protein [Xanthobacter pseudotagetidis]|uniref:L,D-transpeptidase family protein n=1 Tax=Xanthobacter pseudotagetidis TaxID=3119911 RepID=UPI003727315A